MPDALVRKCISIATTAICAALLLGASVASSAAPQWQNVDPPGASNVPTGNNFGFNSVVVAGGVVYVGTNQQGIWKTTDQGATWAKANTGPGGAMVDGGSQWSMSGDPFNPLVLYATAARGAQGVLKSVDGGTSWTQTLAGSNPTAQQIGTNDVYTISADPFTPGHLLASFHYFWNNSNPSGVIESINGGQTWIAHSPAGNWGAGNGVWFGNDSATWIVGSQSNGLWITHNSGTTWFQFSTTNITHGATEALYRDPATGTLVIANETKALRSTNNGATWQDISAGLYGGYILTIVSDGQNLWTAPSFPLLGDNGGAHAPWLTKSLTGSDAWRQAGTQWPCTPNGGYCNGPVMGAYDASSGDVWATNWNGGVWKLHTGAVVPTPTPTPASSSTATNTLAPTDTPVPTATPTSTATPQPTDTPSPTPTVTPLPASTSTPEPTATSTPTAAPSSTPVPCGVVAVVGEQVETFTRPAAFCSDQ